MAILIIATMVLYKRIYLGVYLSGGLFMALWLAPLMICFYLRCVAECNRAPFDFAEGESELVSGFNIEYGSVTFSLIFIAEYGIIITFSLLTGLLFTRTFLVLIIWLLISSILILRRIYPRFRYDKLMYLAWYKFLPLSIIWLYISYGFRL